MPKLQPPSLNTAGLRELVAARFSAPEWALLWEVPNGTGARKDRTLDAIAMSVWPSRGLEIHGIELKTRRSDLTKELRTPDKGDAVGAYCDRFWIACPKGVAEPSDMPPAWGLLLATPKTLRVAKEAEKLEPKPLDHTFLASLMRKMTTICKEYVHRGDIADEIREACNEAVEMAISNREWKDKSTAQAYESLKKTVEEFEEASGIKIGRWTAGKIGAAVEVVLAGQHDGHANRIRRTGATLREVAAKLDSVLEGWTREELEGESL